MKTSDSIERQEERKRAEKRGNFIAQSSGPVSEGRRRSLANLKPPFPKGVSGNPGGKPKHDVAAELARAIFENNPQVIYKAFLKAIARGNAYAFATLADRGYGKLKESIHAEISPYQEVSTPDLEAHVQELEAKLVASLVERGYIITKPPQLLPPEDAKKPN